MRSLLVVAVAVAVVGAGCSGRPNVSDALKVRVTKRSTAKSVCTKVVVAGAGISHETGPMDVTASMAQVVVGVLRDDLPATVTVQALGFSDAACTTPVSPQEASDAVTVTFGNGVKVVDLSLGPASTADGGTDADNDGHRTPDDCNDGDNTVFPGAPEVCFDGKDNDCDMQSDCADTQCEAMACGSGAGAACSGGACREVDCANAMDDDGDLFADCADSDCDAQRCSARDGGCSNLVCLSPDEVGLCFDSLDNDGDLDVDCADSDCSGEMCNDLDPCTENDTCSGTTCSGGTPKVCNNPPSQCFGASGTCLPDAGGICGYTLRTGGCDDGLKCTDNDTCFADGGCGGNFRTCNAPPGACFTSPGLCSEADDGGCRYAPVAAGGGCSDGNNCTVGDTCDGDGGCVGTDVRPSCSPPGECWATSTTCDPDGGCRFAARTGLGCDGGTCSAGGVCQTFSFPYTPKNFTTNDLPASAGAMTFDCGTTVLNTRSADGGIAWTNNCAGNVQAPGFTLVNNGGVEAVLLFFDSLSITVGNTLRGVGARPLIIGVKTDAAVGGTLDVSSTAASTGAGANQDCGGNRSGVAGATGGNPLTAGGGGGGAYGGNGARGENGDRDSGRGNGGTSFNNNTVTPLHGGCPGGNGGRPAGGSAGEGGAGGGAVQISAVGEVRVLSGATVTAGGQGGRGGSNGDKVAGGGGGAGGAVLLQGATVVLENTAAVTANGGGGGEGSGSSVAGGDGEDGRPRSTTQAAGGVNGPACGGNGGSGGSQGGGPGNGSAPSCSNESGGGGGGGVGRIRFDGSGGCTVNGGAIISPTHAGTGGGC